MNKGQHATVSGINAYAKEIYYLSTVNQTQNFADIIIGENIESCSDDCKCTPATETCNGIDDDCDGQTDEGLAKQCGSSVGSCKYGNSTCSNGQWGSCAGSVSPMTEICANGIDDDCDGYADENCMQNCTDSDGGRNYYAKGDVSGICKDCNPPAYGVGTDQCTDAYRLKEFYCLNSTHWIWEYASCTYGCSDGACKNQTACVAEGGTIPVIQNPPPCCSGLSLIKPKENVLGISGICTAKCGNGACDSVTESNQNCPADCPANASCTDSDGGRNYYVSGAAEKGGSVSYDYCTSPAMLMEHYCWGNNIIVSSTRCPSGCENADKGESLHGACIKGKEPYCGAIGTLNQGWYKENYTSPNLPSGLVRWEKCEGCIADCRYPGTRSEGWYSSCDSSLIAYDNCSGVAPPCPAGISIKSDKEKYAIGDTIFIRIKIYDSNAKGVGGAPFYVQGWRNGESTGLSKNTVDSDGNYEIKGGVTESQLGSWRFDARYNESGCPHISSNVFINIVNASSSCIDSDGGLDYYKKGRVESCPASATSGTPVSSTCTAFEDQCTKPGVLKEGFCKEDKIEGIEYQCPAGCMDGVCVSAKPTETIGFRNAYWRCQDGTEANEGGPTSCKPSEVWRKYSEDFCKGRCSAAVEKCEETGKCAGSGAGKCGVEKFSVTNECGAEPAKVCMDTDGGRDAYVAGRTILGDAKGEDYCYNDGKEVVEYYCSFDSENKTESIGKEEIPCPNGCRGGACTTGEEPKPYKEMRNNITIEKGWNLIAIPGDMGVGLGTCSDALKNQWAFLWWYPPENRFTSMREGETFANIYWQYLRKTAFWAYSPESCELEYYTGNYYTMTSTVQQIQGGWYNNLPQMYAGWNMVIFTQDMLGKKIDDIKGECSVRAAYIYESSGWRNIINESIPSDESVLGHGFLLNVAGDCKLGGISVTPPAFPTGWAIAK